MQTKYFRRTVLSAALLTAFTAPVGATGIFFSEYIEGSSNNKALEIYNDTGSDIDLAADFFSVSMFYNGNTSAGLNIDLTGSVFDGATYVLAHSSAVSEVTSKANQTNGSGWFNGNDAVILYKNGVVMDSIGQVGNSSNYAKDVTLRRLSPVTPDTHTGDVFDPGAWASFARNAFDDLGSFGGSGGNPNTLLTIMEIQGAGHVSPYQGTANVETTGVVTQMESNGFFLQDPNGDANDATSDGIFVYTGSSPSVTVGDGISVVGSVSEYFGATQISSDSITVETTGNSIAPLSIGTDSSAGHGRLIPTRLVDDNGSATFDPSNEGRDFYESIEGMLVRVNNVQAVGSTRAYGSDPDGDGIGNSDREVYAVTDGGIGATSMNSRGGITISGDPSVDNPLAADLNPERILINRAWDDDIDHEIVQGDALSSESDGSIVGTVHYTFNDYIINAANTVKKDRSGSSLVQEVSTIDAGGDRLTVGSYNVLNLDTNDNDGNTDVANGQFAKLADHIVNHGGSPDIVGLQEIQDNSGSTDDGQVSAAATLQALVEAIAAAGGPTYAFVDNPFIGDKTNGGDPAGNIRNTFLYNPERVALKAGSLDAVTDPNDQKTNGANPFYDSRLPLAATFVFQGEEVTVVNNHFASKGGSDPLYGAVQPPANGQVSQRDAMAAAVNGFVEQLLALNADSNVIVLGDLNEFQFYSPLEILANGGDSSVELTDLVGLLTDPSDAYSYNFEGNSQLLDHLLVSANLLGLDPQFDILHLNTGYLYAGLSGSAIDVSQTAASDHDMLLASFRFAGSVPVPAVWALLLTGLLLIRAGNRNPV